MGTTYNGKAGNVSRAGLLTVTSASNTTPIRIITSAAHGLVEGDRVLNVQVGGNTAANGAFYVSVVDSTTFDLYSGWTAGAVSGAVAGAGAWTSGGAVQYLGTMPRATMIEDLVDDLDGSHINPAPENAKDAASYLAERVGGYRLQQVLTLAVAQAPNVTTGVLTATNGAWGDAAALTALVNPASNVYADCIPGDLVEVTFTGTATYLSVGPTFLRFGYEIRDYGVAMTSATTNAGAASQVACNAAAGQLPIHMREVFAPTLTRGQKVGVVIQDWGVAGASTYNLAGDYVMTVKVWRAN